MSVKKFLDWSFDDVSLHVSLYITCMTLEWEDDLLKTHHVLNDMTMMFMA